MATLLDSADRASILQRLRRLHPSAQRRWGTLTAPNMVCHLADQLRVALGDVPAKRVDTLPRRTLLKWLVVYSPLRPPPGKIETAPEMLIAGPTTWSQDVDAVERLVARMAAAPTTAIHPFFGPLTHGGWGRISWKHLDHHLRQFGC
jgi:hypothetical protein